MNRILDKSEALDFFVSQLPPSKRKKFNEFGDLNIVKVYPGKLFVVYNLVHENPVPSILTNFRVTSVELDNYGFRVEVLDLKSGKSQVVGHHPGLMFGYDVFFAAPTVSQVTRILKKNDAGAVIDCGVSCGLLVKHRIRPSFGKPGYIYCLGLADFRTQFGDAAQLAFERLEHMGDLIDVEVSNA